MISPAVAFYLGGALHAAVWNVRSLHEGAQIQQAANDMIEVPGSRKISTVLIVLMGVAQAVVWPVGVLRMLHAMLDDKAVRFPVLTANLATQLWVDEMVANGRLDTDLSLDDARSNRVASYTDLMEAVEASLRIHTRLLQPRLPRAEYHPPSLPTEILPPEPPEAG